MNLLKRIEFDTVGGAVLKVIWLDQTLKEIRQYPRDVKDEIGFLLHRLQMGEQLMMPHSRSMPDIGAGCFEIRVRSEDGSYRVFYCLKFKDEILVFHCFKKQTEVTPKRELDKGKKNLRSLINEKENNN